MDYVVVSVISGVGKGIIASSVGLPIRSMALKLTDIKIEPTINLDTWRKLVTDDGGETDLDLSSYERYLMTTLHPDSGYLVIVSMSEFDNIIDNGLLGAMRDMLERIKNKPQGNRYANKYVSQAYPKSLSTYAESFQTCPYAIKNVRNVPKEVVGILMDLPELAKYMD
ncbi:hypothetical protein PENARI_c026G09989 [Penicillium arizonense]|uniref:CTP synthase N-terminal domain-containing protein n=1 Tax=Penicillium arizonense TaxID=1835702 RepID=A0A1F5L6K8_PENAI|nr:hypothetical protein PENARI_c026G09989 [Penicillium arizonense]OGE48686.1 hypothetical protein PENARI_c026G09989 [Penicillium arizonense]